MSAFLIDDDVFAAIARFLRDEDQTGIVHDLLKPHGLDAVTFCECLRIANHKSLNHRYNDPMPKRGDLAPLNVNGASQLTIPQLVSQLACVDYQCCEYREWTPVGALVAAISNRLAARHIAVLQQTGRYREIRDRAEYRYSRRRGDQNFGEPLEPRWIVKCDEDGGSHWGSLR